MKLVGRDAVIDKLVSTATNPVQGHLVDRGHNWPGVNGLGALRAGRPLHATRPLHFFRPQMFRNQPCRVVPSSPVPALVA